MAEGGSSGRLRLVVVTHERKLLDTECDSVALPARLGEVTILPQHTPVISTLAYGPLAYRSGTTTSRLAIAGGFFEVSDDTVTVLADRAEDPADVDVAAAKQDLEEARALLGTVGGNELTEVRHRIQFAETRIDIAST
jgi:F-type H+-transporting ATPase subunit epsilon